MAEDPRTQSPDGGVMHYPTDYSELSTVYTNFCRVSVTPEELVLDFGLNTQMNPTPGEPIKLTHRVVMNFYTAKRLLGALANVVQAHENNYGPLELDYQRRARPQPRPGMPPAGATGRAPGQ